jgi:hypothetical protein
VRSIHAITCPSNRRATSSILCFVFAAGNCARGAPLAPVNYAAGANPTSVIIGDFNGDGKLDLAVADLGGNNGNLLLGNGDVFRFVTHIGSLLDYIHNLPIQTFQSPANSTEPVETS